MSRAYASNNLSVVIPVFNRPETIADAIRTALSQSSPPSEIIVIDDGSDDDTRAATERFKNDIIYVWQKNQGVSAARNTGMLKAQGDWIAFLDSDDEWEPRRLEALHDGLLDPETVMCWNNSAVQGRDGKWWDAFKSAALFNDEATVNVTRSGTFLLRGATYPSAICVRRAPAIDIGGFRSGLSAFEDQHFFVRLSQYGKTRVDSSILTRICRKVSKAATLTDLHIASYRRGRQEVIKAFVDLRGSEKFTIEELGSLNERIEKLRYDDVRSVLMEEGRLAAAKSAVGLFACRPLGYSTAKCLAMLIMGPHSIERRDLPRKVRTR